LCRFIKKYHNTVEISIIIPPVNDVINDVFKPLIKICGEILLISGTALNAALTPRYVAKIPTKALKIPSNTIPLVL
jgi:hypothetical protein